MRDFSELKGHGPNGPMINTPMIVSDHSVSSKHLGQQLQMPDAHMSWDCVEAQWGNDAWQNEDAVD